MDFSASSLYDESAVKQKSRYAVVFVIFALLCLITSMIFNSSLESKISFTVPATGSVSPKPIKVSSNNSVYEMRVSQHAGNMKWNQDWSAVSIEILDSKKEYLFGFGDEFWRASGYDEGNWYETKDDYKMKVTFPKKGVYFVHLDVERSSPAITNAINVTLDRKVASALPFFIAGLLSLIIGVALACLDNPQWFENMN